MKFGAAATMFKCMPFLCNRHVDYVNKSNCNLSSVPDEVLRYGRTLEELLLDSNQIKDLPKVGTLRIMLGSWRAFRHANLPTEEVSTQNSQPWKAVTIIWAPQPGTT